jgi:hypothetical protein
MTTKDIFIHETSFVDDIDKHQSLKSTIFIICLQYITINKILINLI